MRIEPQQFRGGVATLNLMLSGYAHALERLARAAKEHDGRGAFRGIFEALNWAVALDERIKDEWAPEGKPLGWQWRHRVAEARAMAGVRFVRNRVHHQWAQALVRDDGGVSDPIADPITDFVWRWRRASELPAGRDDRGRDVYDEVMAGEKAELILFRVGLAFETVGALLEPPRPTPHSE